MLENLDSFIENSKSDFLPDEFKKLKEASFRVIEKLTKADEEAKKLKIADANLWDVINLDDLKISLNNFSNNLKEIKKSINDKTIVSSEKRRARDLVNKLIDSGFMFMITYLQRACDDVLKNRGESFVNRYVKPFQMAFIDKRFRDKQNAFKPDLIKEIKIRWENIIRILNFYFKDQPNKINSLNIIGNDIINRLNNIVLTGWNNVDIDRVLNEFKNIKEQDLNNYLNKNVLNIKQTTKYATAGIEELTLSKVISALDNIISELYLNKDLRKIKTNTSSQPQQDPLIMITNKSRGFIEALKNLDLKKVSSERSLSELQSEQNEAFASLSIALQSNPQIYQSINNLKQLSEQILNKIYAAYKYKSSDKTRSFFYNIASEIKNYISQISPLKQRINDNRTNLQDDAEIKFYKYFDSWIGDLIVYTNSIAKQIEEIKNS